MSATSIAIEASNKDHWDSETYSKNVAPYVPALTSKVVALLDPQPHDSILDLGCGDGVLTSKLSPHCKDIVGIDSSPNMIYSANSAYSEKHPNTVYIAIDALSITSPDTQSQLISHLSTSDPASPQAFNKIFSNAALHWILRPLAPSEGIRDLSALVTFFKACYDLLVPGGYLVSESGAHGNVPEVHAALISALIHRGMPPKEARATCPWFFPSTGLMTTVLTRAGFVVETCEAELRQTEVVDGSVESWVRLFGAQMLDKIEDFVTAKERGDVKKGRKAREETVQEVVEAVEAVGRRVEDGAFVLGYVRLRVKARKPV